MAHHRRSQRSRDKRELRRAVRYTHDAAAALRQAAAESDADASAIARDFPDVADIAREEAAGLRAAATRMDREAVACGPTYDGLDSRIMAYIVAHGPATERAPRARGPAMAGRPSFSHGIDTGVSDAGVLTWVQGAPRPTVMTPAPVRIGTAVRGATAMVRARRADLEDLHHRSVAARVDARRLAAEVEPGDPVEHLRAAAEPVSARRRVGEGTDR